MGKTLTDFIIRGVAASKPASGSSGKAGRIYIESDGDKKWWYDNGTTWDDITPNGGGGGSNAALYLESDVTPVVNTTAVTSVISGSGIDTAKLDLPAGWWDTVGRMVIFECAGNLSAASSGTPVLAIGPGFVTLGSPLGFSAFISNDFLGSYSFRAKLWCTVPGVSATFKGLLELVLNNSDFGTTESLVFIGNGSGMDASGDMTLDLTLNWFAADPDSSVDTSGGVTISLFDPN